MILNFYRVVYDVSDDEVRFIMYLVSCYVGIGFGNVGCYLW